MWWMVVAVVVVIAGIFLMERNRGTRAEAAKHDPRHLRGPGTRGGRP